MIYITLVVYTLHACLKHYCEEIVGTDEIFSKFTRPSSPKLQTGPHVGYGPDLEPVRESVTNSMT